MDVLVVLAKRCWAAQRERDTASELRQSLSRQVTDLTHAPPEKYFLGGCTYVCVCVCVCVSI
jgi:hypothetical protein